MKTYKIKLQSSPKAWREVYWNNPPKFIENGEFETTDKAIAELISELDRRFVQLWDKVSYEKGE